MYNIHNPNSIQLKQVHCIIDGQVEAFVALISGNQSDITFH